MNKKEIKSASGMELVVELGKEQRRRSAYAVAFNVAPQGSAVERALQRARDACDSLDYEITKELERRFVRLVDLENAAKLGVRPEPKRPQRTPTMREAEAAIADVDKPPAKKVRKKVSKK